MLFPELAVGVEGVLEDGDGLRIQLVSAAAEAFCPSCSALSRGTHGWCRRRLKDVAILGRSDLLELRFCRFVCIENDCSRRTFREQIPGLARRWARRTERVTSMIAGFGFLAARRAGSRLLESAGIRISRDTVLRVVMSLALPFEQAQAVGEPVPAVLGVDDVAIRKGHSYATIIIDATTHRPLDLLPDRLSEPLATWLRAHPGVAIACRGGSNACAEAIRDDAPEAVQVNDRWHLWRGLGEAVEKVVTAHAACWRSAAGQTLKAPPKNKVCAATVLAERTAERHRMAHDLLAQGLSMMECRRRLGWGLNTVNRYARAATAQELQKPPRYRATLVDPYRDHLRRRLIEEPTVALTHLLAEIREQRYPGSANLLFRYINQGRLDLEHPPARPRKVTSWMMTDPTNLGAHDALRLKEVLDLCPDLNQSAFLIAQFAHMMMNRTSEKLTAWMDAAEALGQSALKSFVTGLRQDQGAVTAALSLEHSNGPTEGTNTKIKLLKRQIYGRAGFPLLRQRILLN
ncbi:ISL3 family transposase [Kineosporia succinea]|uniref:Transposase n=1 Tax=Kineosporia succinea TaxID=84632 RepID=A0ABT9PBS9_9ACTN|nr:ISL3 family transposase [Kineosporia succinea]MDP9830158.1 transposase [Kineosporia succinea]